jgi:hypothetical protein
MINGLENKPQQYTIGFLVGLSGKSSNMTKSSDWLQGYCAGLQQRLRGYDSEDSTADTVEASYHTAPVALPTPPSTAYNVQQSVITSGSALTENTRTASMYWSNGNSALNTIRSGYIPRFPGDGPLARSGPMGQFQMPPKASGPVLRQTPFQTLTGYSGNRVVSQKNHNNSSIGFSDFQVSRDEQDVSRESVLRVDHNSDTETQLGSSISSLALQRYPL